MLVQMVDKIEQKLFTEWSTQVKTLLSTFSEGLNKINFGNNPPEEIKNLQNLIKQAQQETDRKNLIKQIMEIIALQEKLYAENEFSSQAVQHYFYQGHRAFTLSLSSLKAEQT